MTAGARQRLLINSRLQLNAIEKLPDKEPDTQLFMSNQLLHVQKRFHVAALLRPVGLGKDRFIAIPGQHSLIICLKGDLTAMHPDRLFFQVCHAGNVNRLQAPDPIHPSPDTVAEKLRGKPPDASQCRKRQAQNRPVRGMPVKRGRDIYCFRPEK